MKNVLFVLIFLLASVPSFAQTSNEWKLTIGFNSLFLTEKKQSIALLPDFTTIVDLNYESSVVTVGTNYGIQRAFSVSKNKSWRIITGLQYQDFAYEVNAFSDSNDSRFLYTYSNKVSQWDVPLLVSYIKSKGKFTFGADGGVFQTVFVNALHTSRIDQVPINNPELLGESTVDLSGFVTQPLRKMSAYLAPFARLDLTDWLSYEVQPFIRYQGGGPAFGTHSSTNNPAFGQWGVNTGLVFKFGKR